MNMMVGRIRSECQSAGRLEMGRDAKALVKDASTFFQIMGSFLKSFIFKAFTDTFKVG